MKGQIRIKGKQGIQTKVMGAFFALFADVECDLISDRTREGLAKARSSGKKPGRSKGPLGVSRLDGKNVDACICSLIRAYATLNCPQVPQNTATHQGLTV